MERLKLITVAIIFVGITHGCKTHRVLKESREIVQTQLTIFQNGIEKTINQPSESIEIEQDLFSLRFYNKKYDSENEKFYSAQIAALLNKAEFDKIKIGMATSDLPCFEPGTGMAASRNYGYEKLIFNNKGHHYVYYENSESKRANLLEEANGLVRLEFEISRLYYDNQEIKMTDTELKNFYLVFLIDKNLNERIEKDELHKINIKVKQRR